MLHYVVSILFIYTPTRHTNKDVSCYVMLGPRCISNLSFNITFKWNKNKLSTSGTRIPGSQEYQCLVHIQYRYLFHFGVCGLHRRGWSSLNLVDFPQRKQPGCNMVDFFRWRCWKGSSQYLIQIFQFGLKSRAKNQWSIGQKLIKKEGEQELG